MLKHLSQGIERGLAGFLALLLVTMVITVTWQVVSRYLLGDPSGWTEELARFLLIWIGLFGGAYAYHRRLHLGLELLAEKLRRAGAGGDDRLARWHSRLIDACVLLFALAVLVIGGSSLVALTNELEQFSPALGLPMGNVYLALPISGALITISAALALLDPQIARQEPKPGHAA